MLATINEYSGLINFTLFGVIFGFLFHLQKTSREALNDKFESQLESLRSKISLLETQEKVTLANHQAAIKLLEQQLSFYKSLSDMPEDRKVLAIKTEYQQKLSELEVELARRTGSEDELKQQLAAVQVAVKEASKSPSLTEKAAISILEKVIHLAIKTAY